jgi:hypothetical protein
MTSSNTTRISGLESVLAPMLLLLCCIWIFHEITFRNCLLNGKRHIFLQIIERISDKTHFSVLGQSFGCPITGEGVEATAELHIGAETPSRRKIAKSFCGYIFTALCQSLRKSRCAEILGHCF